VTGTFSKFSSESISRFEDSIEKESCELDYWQKTSFSEGSFSYSNPEIVTSYILHNAISRVRSMTAEFALSEASKSGSVWEVWTE
jgi:hypothetical protein